MGTIRSVTTAIQADLVAALLQTPPAGWTVYPATVPMMLNESGKIALIHPPSFEEIRKGTPAGQGTGNGGAKWQDYEWLIELEAVSHDPTGTDQLNFYDSLDAVLTTLRNDPTLGGVSIRANEDMTVNVEEVEADETTLRYRASINTKVRVELKGV